MITERTLKKWRREALELLRVTPIDSNRTKLLPLGVIASTFATRILRMTQELTDIHLLREKMKGE